MQQKGASSMKEYFDKMMEQVQNSDLSLEDQFYNQGYINALRDVGYLSLAESMELSDQMIIEGRRRRWEQRKTQPC